ncbi:MAG: competence/damage-inducible protein A [Clostridia bacterium]|nr:competence/damage-inducible protein A [Clostridia bacterium]
MKAEIISVGNEVLSGFVVNTDTSYLSKKLFEMGFEVNFHTVVPDERKRIQAALRSAVSRSQVIIFTGGLGPTPDDITREAVSSAVGLELVRDDEVLAGIKRYFKDSGRSFPKANEKQAYFPEGAVVFPNRKGTAAGFAISAGSQHILLLPGPPAELRAVFEDGAEEYLSEFLDMASVTRTVNVFGIGESHVCEKISKYLKKDNPYVATYVAGGEVQVRVTARDRDRREAQRKCVFVSRDIAKILGDNAYGIDSEGIEHSVVELLLKNGMTIATAESCTAGLVSKRITDVPGASSVFRMGTVAYSDEVKMRELFVRPETIEEFSAVSGETAKEMAMGIKQVSGANIGISVTGVAGPESDNRGNPVGLVFVSMTDGKRFWTRKLNIVSGGQSREHIRNLAASNALDLARRYLAALPDFPDGYEEVEEGDIPVTTENPIPVSPAAEFDAAAFAAAFAVADSESRSQPVAEKTAAGAAGAAAVTSFTDISSDSSVDFDNKATEALSENGEESSFSFADDIFARLNLPEDNTEEEKDEKDDNVLMSSSGAVAADVFSPRDNSMTRELFDNAFPEEGAAVTDENNDQVNTSSRKVVSKANQKKGFIKTVFPCKGDSVFDIIRKSILLLAAVALIVCLVILAVYFTGTAKNAMVENDIKELYGNGDSVDLEAIGFPSGANATDFAALYAENKDTVGWIKVSNTKVDNVVVKGENNDYYLKHTFYKKYNDHGTVFMDYRCNFDLYNRSQNLVIYGHHMNDGSMFASLKNLRSLKNFKKSNLVYFNNLYSNDTYEIFAVIITNDDSADDDGYRFEYNKVYFSSDADFNDHIARLKERSIYETGIEVTPDDELITLVTCIYDFNEARLVMVGRKLREGDSPVSTANFTRKSDKKVVYPQAWYDKNGGKKPANALPDGFVDDSTSSEPTSSDNTTSDTTTSTQTPGGNNNNNNNNTTSTQQPVTSGNNSQTQSGDPSDTPSQNPSVPDSSENVSGGSDGDSSGGSGSDSSGGSGGDSSGGSGGDSSSGSGSETQGGGNSGGSGGETPNTSNP